MTSAVFQPAPYVKSLPPRVAHATHALLVTAKERGAVPVKASEIVIHDWEALSTQVTVNALTRAKHEGLALSIGGVWIATEKAHAVADQLEDRSFADQEARDG